MSISVSPLDPTHLEHLETVVQRMRLTLTEVVDSDKGADMYSLEWLRARVLFHLDASQCRGAVFLAWEDRREMVGHTILRVEEQQDGSPYGLFSTFYVLPEARRSGVGSALVDCGETWFREQGLTCFATNTAIHNHKLIQLLENRGYQIAFTSNNMVHLRCASA